MIDKLTFTTQGANHDDLDENAWAIAEAYYGVGETYSIVWSSDARYSCDKSYNFDHTFTITSEQFEADFTFMKGKI